MPRDVPVEHLEQRARVVRLPDDLVLRLKELVYLFPNSVPMNRGAYKLNEIFEYATKKGFSDIVIVHEHRGEPDGLIVSHLPVGPTIFFGLSNTVLRHDIDGQKEGVSLAYPHLVFHNFKLPSKHY